MAENNRAKKATRQKIWKLQSDHLIKIHFYYFSQFEEKKFDGSKLSAINFQIERCPYNFLYKIRNDSFTYLMQHRSIKLKFSPVDFFANISYDLPIYHTLQSLIFPISKKSHLFFGEISRSPLPAKSAG